jgi:hypothetical protein
MSTLIGLMARAPIDWTKPSNDDLNSMMQRAEELLHELHQVLNLPGQEQFVAAMEKAEAAGDEVNPFEAGAVLREPIFYSAESAYASQYRDFAVKKYGADDEWLKRNRGFTIGEASSVLSAFSTLSQKKLPDTLKSLKDKPEEEWTLLPGFQFTVEEIATESKIGEDAVKKIFEALSLKDTNPTFTALGEFNATNAFPLIRPGDGKYTSFQFVALAEAIYESPFFWMLADKKYEPTATANRGNFVEALAAERLEKVFGGARVYKNVDIWKSKGENVGEIDVLVLFADRAIILQAKSKKLTQAARRGSDVNIQEDFRAAVQDACDQAFTCAEELVAGKCTFKDPKGNEIKLPSTVKQVFPICVVSDHYPALSFQTRQFLKYHTTEKISAPLVSDLFMLDVMTEFLDTPLRCLSYLDLRALAGGNVMASHEITTLAYHLKQNLWLGEYDFIQMHDDISADVDIAMATRRDGVDGERTPPGVLTFLEGKSLGRLLDELNALATPWTTAAGLELMKLGSDTAADLCTIIDRLAQQAANGKDGSSTLVFSNQSTGLTIQCNNRSMLDAVLDLKQHCEKRKYSQKAASWNGILVHPGTGALRHCLVLDAPWKEDADLAQAAAELIAADPQSVKHSKKVLERFRRGKES